jgi:diaminopimelate epimerase
VFYNSDGSKAEACGNGTVASGVYVSGFLGKENITLETDSGLANITVDGNKATIELPMPKVTELRNDAEIKNLVSFTSVMSINVGNPHCVLLVKEIPQNWQEIGSKIENMTHIFPHKTNVEFVRELGNNAFEVLVWERGAGRTFACGTGACGVAFAMVKNGLADSKHPIEIYMEGSKIYGNGKAISVQLLENSILMTNHAFFEGRIDV